MAKIKNKRRFFAVLAAIVALVVTLTISGSVLGAIHNEEERTKAEWYLHPDEAIVIIRVSGTKEREQRVRLCDITDTIADARKPVIAFTSYGSGDYSVEIGIEFRGLTVLKPSAPRQYKERAFVRTENRITGALDSSGRSYTRTYYKLYPSDQSDSTESIKNFVVCIY